MKGAGTTGYLLGDHIHVGIGNAEGPAHIPDGPPGGHGAKGDNLGHMVCPIFLLDILNDLLPAADTEVNVNIGHSDPFRVEKPLEIEGIFHGVHIGDGQTIGYHRACRRTSPGAYRNAPALSIPNKIGDNQKIVYKSHLPDDTHLIGQPLLIAFWMVRITAGKALLAQLLEVGVPIGVPLRQLELRQVISAELEVHVAQIGNFQGIFHRLGILGKKSRHFFCGFDIKLAGLHFQTVGVIHRFSHLDTHEGILHPGILPAEVMGVVGDHQGNTGLLMDADQSLIDGGVIGQIVILEFQVIAVLPEEGLHFQCGSLGPFIVSRQNTPGYLSRLTG